ncbi:MAG: DUF1834 family protein [Deltaproteobacteria bacterium]|nr:DUF1834 family protein [Deltaproteobacteria bacterium]
MNYTFTDYEEAVLAALAELKSPEGYLLTLEGFAGQLGLDPETQHLEFFGRYPAVLVEVEGAEYEPESWPYWRETVTLNFLVVAKSYRSQDTARVGEAGAYAILADLRRLLVGNTLDLEVMETGMEPVSVSRLQADQNMVIYEAKYRLVNPRMAKEG